MTNGFKDKDGKFHPILNNLPEGFKASDLLKPDAPTFSDEALNKHFAKKRVEAERLRGVVNEQIPQIINIITNLKDSHKQAVEDADRLLKDLENKSSRGDTLPLEYLNLDEPDYDNFIRDWSSLNFRGEEFPQMQNLDILADLKRLKEFKNKLDQFNEANNEVS